MAAKVPKKIHEKTTDEILDEALPNEALISMIGKRTQKDTNAHTDTEANAENVETT